MARKRKAAEVDEVPKLSPPKRTAKRKVASAAAEPLPAVQHASHGKVRYPILSIAGLAARLNIVRTDYVGHIRGDRATPADVGCASVHGSGTAICLAGLLCATASQRLYCAGSPMFLRVEEALAKRSRVFRLALHAKSVACLTGALGRQTACAIGLRNIERCAQLCIQVPGKVWLFGDGDCGQLGFGEDITERLRPAPLMIDDKKVCRRVSCPAVL